MRQDHRFRKEKGLTAEQKRLIPLAALAAVAVVLIAVILFADRGKKEAASAETQPAVEDTAESAETLPEEETALPDDAPEPGEEPESTQAAEPETTEDAGADPYATDALQRDSMPELLDVMKRYFAARAGADAETINALYGIEGLSESELQAEKLRLMSNSKYISSFDDVVTYVMQGTDENSWLVYSTANIKFYTAKTKAPMVMWCFIERTDDGGYRMLNSEDLPTDKTEFANTANHSDAVRNLAGDINAQLNQALAADEDLKTVYGILRSGSPVYEGDAEVVVMDESSETAEEKESEAESENAAEEETAVPAETAAETAQTESAAEAGTEAPAANEAQ